MLIGQGYGRIDQKMTPSHHIPGLNTSSCFLIDQKITRSHHITGLNVSSCFTVVQFCGRSR